MPADDDKEECPPFDDDEEIIPLSMSPRPAEIRYDPCDDWWWWERD